MEGTRSKRCGLHNPKPQVEAVDTVGVVFVGTGEQELFCIIKGNMWLSKNGKARVRHTVDKPLPPELPPVKVLLVASDQEVGRSPRFLGVNMGHRAVGTNAWHFMRRMGVNAARIFLYNTILEVREFLGEAAFGRDLSGKLVEEEEGYLAAVRQLRSTKGHSLEYDGWANPVRWHDIYGNFSQLQPDIPAIWGTVEDSVDRMMEIGVKPLGVLSMFCTKCKDTSSLGSDPRPRFGGIFELQANSSTDPGFWGERWELYKVIYTVATWTWRKRVFMIELYNEPELEGCWDVPRFMEQTIIRSMAVQHAYADLNKEFPEKSLKVEVIGPSIVGGYYGADNPVAVRKGDYGRLVVQAMHTLFPGNTADPKWNTIHSYSYHAYNKGGVKMLYDATRLSDAMKKDAVLPIMLTEYNIHTNYEWDMRPTTVDTPWEVTKLGGQMGRLIPVLDGIFLFKLSQMLPMPPFTYGHGVQKNGVHYGDNEGPHYNLADSSRLAEAFRLIAEVSSAAKPLLNLTLSPEDPLRCAFAVADTNSYYIFVVNEDEAKPMAMELDLSSLPGIIPGSTAVASLIATGWMGDVAAMVQLPKTGPLSLSITLPVTSLTRFQVPRSSTPAPLVALRIPPAADTTLRSGLLSSKAYGKQPLLTVRTSGTKTQDKTAIAVLRFDMAKAWAKAPTNSSMATAVLEVHLKRGGRNGNNILQVLGLPAMADDWNETSTTWTDNLNLKPLSKDDVVNATRFNFIKWNTTPAPIILGHMVIPPNATDQWLMVDVRRWVADKSGPLMKSIMIVRPFRYDANSLQPGDSLSYSSAVFHSREGPLKLRPRLSVQFVINPVSVKAMEQGTEPAVRGKAGAVAAVQEVLPGGSDKEVFNGEVKPAKVSVDVNGSGAALSKMDLPIPEKIASGSRPTSNSSLGASSKAGADSSTFQAGKLDVATKFDTSSIALGDSKEALEESSSRDSGVPRDADDAVPRHWYDLWRWSGLSVSVLLLLVPMLSAVCFMTKRYSQRAANSAGGSPKKSRKRRPMLG